MKTCLTRDQKHLNAKDILGLFGLRYEPHIAPLAYAALVENRISLKNELFPRFTSKFEEAKYSRHALEENDSSSALDDYNNLIKRLTSKHGKPYLCSRYLLVLIYRKPLLLK